MLSLRKAIASEQRSLEELQWRASLGNPGDRAALLANRDAIELPIAQIEAGGVFVAEIDGVIVGYAAVVPREDGESELDALFVEPDMWRRGIGRALVEHCCAASKNLGIEWLYVVGNPHAEKFYRSCGFVSLGTKATRFGVGLVMKRSVR